MGVPGFFAWILKKYKDKKIILSKLEIKNDKIDYLLIDANCLLHGVLNDIIDNIEYDTDEIFENKFINEIIKYLEYVINVANAEKKSYFAIDGVAPMAKIKQQRIRRYSSIHEVNVRNEIKKKYNKVIIKKWDRTAITPGTPFMYKLHLELLNFEKKNKNFIYSSYLEPGEGEHKLLQFIKEKENNEEINTYAFYGLDADLIFLSLTIENQSIYLLRENTLIDNNNKDNDLVFISIEILKESIYTTMSNIYKFLFNKEIIFNYNNIVNDFIFICYLLGNDFLPHLPSIDIKNNGLDIVINNYFNAFEEINLKNKINKNNFIYIISETIINKKFITLLFRYLSLEEHNILNKKYYNKKKIYKRYNNNYDPYNDEIYKLENLQFDIKDNIELGKDDFESYRKRYYKHYWDVEEDEIENFSFELTKQYFIGLKWTTIYYFDKCPSWNWYYPYDNAPFVTDIYKYISKINFNKVKFKIGEPVEPIIQLLIVLPRQVSYLLPKIFNEKIPTTYYGCMYPIDYEIDFINKNKYFQATPILPWLNIKLIIKFYNTYKKYIKNNEKIYIYNKI